MAERPAEPELQPAAFVVLKEIVPVRNGAMYFDGRRMFMENADGEMVEVDGELRPIP